MVMDSAEVDAVVSDQTTFGSGGSNYAGCEIPCTSKLVPRNFDRGVSRHTEWVLLTSGTTGRPKLAVHTLGSLTGAIKRGNPPAAPVVWATFYDIRRYGGLQIFFRAVLSGASLVIASAEEPMTGYLDRLGPQVTHLSGTPSHWRRALMSPAIREILPAYVRLSGEIADQAILDNLRSFFPRARVGHAYASTEAGVAFEVNDGRAGFPASFVGIGQRDVDVKIEDGSLRLRSARTASCYAGRDTPALLDADGFVDTGDMVELRGDRYHFVGRKGGIINVGGQKVHPEEVEAAINRHPAVWASLVRARRSPITGAIVAAEVVLKDTSIQEDGMAAQTEREIIELCRQNIAPHKVPAVIRFVPSLNVSDTGKLLRHGRP